MSGEFHGLPAPQQHGKTGTQARSIFSSDSTLLTGLVSWWDLDETSGTRDDAVGSNDLTDNNTVGYAAGKIGNASSCAAGNSESLTVAADIADGNNPLTVSFWFKISANVITPNIVGRYVSGGGNKVWRVYRHTNGYCYASFSSDGIADDGAVNTGAAVATSLNTWYFGVIWHDPVNDVVGIQINTTANTAAFSAGMYASSTAPIQVNQSPSSGNMDVDMVGIWSRVLTSDERTELYNLGASIKNPFTDNGEGFRTGLQAYWKLDETSGTRYDETTNNYDLTDNNTVGYTTGKSGNAASFVSTNSEYLNHDAGAGKEIIPKGSTGAFTVSGWFYLNPANYAAFARVYEFDDGSNFSLALNCNAGATDVTATLWTDVASVTSAGIGATSTGWYFIAVGSNGDNKVYTSKNGATWTVSTAAAGGLRAARRLFVACRTGPANFLTLYTDELSCWNRLLSSAEIAALYASGAGRYYDFQV